MIIRRSTVVKHAPNASTLALEVQAVALRSRPEMDAAFDAKKQEMTPGATVTSGPMTATQVHVVAPGDNLSKISTRYYGTAGKWRTIYEANKSVIGLNPNVIHPGQRLTIPGVL